MVEGVVRIIMKTHLKEETTSNFSNQLLIKSNNQLNLLQIHSHTNQDKPGVIKDNSYLMTNQPLKPRIQSRPSSQKKDKAKGSFNQLFCKPVQNRAKWKKTMQKALNSLPVVLFMAAITLFALFATDIQAACLPIEVDEPFNYVQCFILVVFSIELVLNCLANEDYPLSYFFWIDLIAAISMIQDIDFIFYDIIGYHPIPLTTSKNSKKNSAQAEKLLASVSSASRTIKVLRIIRLLKLLRMVRLYKNVYKSREDDERKKCARIRKSIGRIEGNSTEISTNASKSHMKDHRIQRRSINPLPDRDDENIGQAYQPSSPSRFRLRNANIVNLPALEVKPKQIDKLDADELIKESRISKIITTSNSKKTVILILSLMIFLSILSEDFYTDDSLIVYSFIAQVLSNYYNSLYHSLNPSFAIPDDLSRVFDTAFPPINITYNSALVYVNEAYLNQIFRIKEVRSHFSDDGSIHIVYSVKTETKLIGYCNIFQTLFVCLCLVIVILRFEHEVTRYVLQPLEVIIEIVEKAAKDPVNARNIDVLQSGIKSSVEKLSKHISINYEIQVVKVAIIKITALLAIGFGEAGAEIIKKNLSPSHDLNLFLKGKRKTAIFGFCDIRDFEKINIALEGKSILFINLIAEIVHSSVDRFRGSTNKNMGDSFFNVWKFYKEASTKESPKSLLPCDNLYELDPSNPRISAIADCSVLACLRILMKINKNSRILSYRKNERILKLLPNYKLTMGFGLHFGYAIEGAVGSSYKIEASYLSPHVNIAARLESATRQFGVPLLISGTLYGKLSDELKALCRFVDCVLVKGSQQPLDLYTIDLHLDLTPQKEKSYCIISNKVMRTVYAEKKAALQSIMNEYGSVTGFILDKQSYIELIKQRDENFTQFWAKAIAAYKCGDWKEAETFLLKCSSIDQDDGPTKTLYSYILNRKLIPPERWEGVRELTSK